MNLVLRKLTAILLLFLMMVVMATSQGGIFYCLCLDTMTVGSCGCEVAGEEGPQADHAGSELEGDLCHCCHESESVEESVSTVGPHDCNVELLLSLGDFCGTSPSFHALDELSEVDTLGRAGWEDGAFSVRFNDGRWSCRPPPDPSRSHSVPLYLRHLVFLV